MGFISLGNPWQLTMSKYAHVDIIEVFLAKEWKSFHLLGKKTRLLPPQGFYLKYECELYLKQPWLRHNTRSMLPTTPRTIDLPLKLNNEWISLSLEILDYAIFFFYNIVKNEAYFVLECPSHNPIRDKIPSIFENVVPKNLKSFFQLDHQVDISLYLTETTVLATLEN